jgi:hypothetical protein
MQSTVSDRSDECGAVHEIFNFAHNRLSSSVMGLHMAILPSSLCDLGRHFATPLKEILKDGRRGGPAVGHIHIRLGSCHTGAQHDHR